MNIQGPALDLPSVNGSWSGIGAVSGWSLNPEEDQPSASSSPFKKQAGPPYQILIAEDNAADVFLIRAAIEAARIDAEIHVVKDGEQAMKFFDQADADSSAPCPAVVLLDINLPRKPGGEVLRHMRESHRCANALVIVVSSSDSARDREDMTKLGANGYFHKPSGYIEFLKLGTMVRELLSTGSLPS
jgi:chemotaxis family two-component system response regulator Rcp1